MHRHSAVAAGLALALVLAGCTFAGGGQGEPAPRESVTPAPVPTVEEYPDDNSRLPLPVIADETSISASELAAEHESAYEGQAIRITEQFNLTVTGVEVTDQRVSRSGTVLYDRAGGFQLNQTRRVVYLGPGSRARKNISIYANESVRYRRTVAGSNVSYARSDGGSYLLPRNTSVFVRQYLAVETATAERITIDGQPHYLLRGSDVEGDVFSLTEDYSVRAIVRTDGTVRVISVSYTEPLMERTRVVERTIRIDPVGGDSLQMPGWVERAQNRTSS